MRHGLYIPTSDRYKAIENNKNDLKFVTHEFETNFDFGMVHFNKLGFKIHNYVKFLEVPSILNCVTYHLPNTK